ncbi:hypothetical protein Neosp_014803 [[Neocosmospora] mangrovei]
MIRHDKDLRNYLWSRSGLDFRYDHHFGSVLRTKYAEKAQSLLSEIKKWDAFVVVQSGDQKVYYWNTDILTRYFNSVDQVAQWIEEKRAQARARYENQAPSTPGPIRRRRVTLSDHRSASSVSSPYYRAPSGSSLHRRGLSLTESRGTMPPPSTPTTPRFHTNMQLTGYSTQPHPSSPTQSRPFSLTEALHEMIVGERKVEDMMKKMEISPSPSLAASPRTSWIQGSNPGSGFPTPHTPSRSLPQQMAMASSMAGSQRGTLQTPSRFTTPTSPASGTPLNLNLTPIPLNLGSPPRSQQLGPVQLQATPGAQLDPHHQLSSHQVFMSQPRPMTGGSAPLGHIPQAASQSTQPNSSIPAFGQAGYLNHPAPQAVHSTIDGFAVQAGQTATGSVSQPLLQSTQSAQHVALQEPTSEGEASPLVMQLLTHHRRQQSGQQQTSSISPSGGLLPTDYHRTLNTFPITGSAQPASVTTPTKKARPNFHFGLSPLPVPPEALKQPHETAQTATAMTDVNSGFTNYREPTVDDEMDEMDTT